MKCICNISQVNNDTYKQTYVYIILINHFFVFIMNTFMLEQGLKGFNRTNPFFGTENNFSPCFITVFVKILRIINGFIMDVLIVTMIYNFNNKRNSVI